MQITNWQTITTPVWKPGWQLVDICVLQRVYRFPMSWIGAVFCSNNWFITVTTSRNRRTYWQARVWFVPLQTSKMCPAGQWPFPGKSPGEDAGFISSLIDFCLLNSEGIRIFFILYQNIFVFSNVYPKWVSQGDTEVRLSSRYFTSQAIGRHFICYSWRENCSHLYCSSPCRDQSRSHCADAWLVAVSRKLLVPAWMQFWNIHFFAM